MGVQVSNGETEVKLGKLIVQVIQVDGILPLGSV